MSGELKKMKIQAVKDGRVDNDLIYYALVNPETYKVKHEVVFNGACPPAGSVGKHQQYSHTNADNLQFDFIFDSTGVIPKPLTGLAGALSNIPIAGAIAEAIANQKYDIFEEISLFKKIVLNYDGDIHEPRTVQLLWGTLFFEGYLSSLEFNYKLFHPDGTPIRVVATAVFIASIMDDLEEAFKRPNSPDLTHIRIVKEGDTLPLMAYKIYGDPAYYIEVAKVNKLTNFRNLTPGDKIFFPPINKSK